LIKGQISLPFPSYMKASNSNAVIADKDFREMPI